MSIAPFADLKDGYDQGYNDALEEIRRVFKISPEIPVGEIPARCKYLAESLEEMDEGEK